MRQRQRYLIALLITLSAICIAGVFLIVDGPESAANSDARSSPAYVLPSVNRGDSDLLEAIHNRRSTRSYGTGPLSSEDLAVLLWSTIGTTVDSVSGPTRAAPSAGATNPLEIYVAVEEVESLTPGVYRYIPHRHHLEMVSEGRIGERLSEAALQQLSVADAPVTIVIAAEFRRTTARYGDRGVRYVHFEAGHASQNLVLVAESLGLGSVIIGAFNDRMVSDLIRSGSEEPLLLIPIGPF